MPKYDFRCEACHVDFSLSLPMGTESLPACEACNKNTDVRKIIRAPMIHFKGTGFYKTDSTVTTKTKPKEVIAETQKAADVKTEVKPAETKTTEKKTEPKK